MSTWKQKTIEKYEKIKKRGYLSNNAEFAAARGAEVLPLTRNWALHIDKVILILTVIFLGTLAAFSIADNQSRQGDASTYEKARSVILITSAVVFGIIALIYTRRYKRTFEFSYDVYENEDGKSGEKYNYSTKWNPLEPPGTLFQVYGLKDGLEVREALRSAGKK